MKAQVLVTGATGCVGANIVKHLNDRGVTPRVLIRRTSKTLGIDDLRWEGVYGDLTDPASLGEAVAGCSHVYHAAALVTFWRRRWPEAERVNVQGTRDLVDASRRAGVGDFVLTSTTSAVGFCEAGQETVDEETPFNYGPYGHVYNTTKRRAEEIVLAASTDRFRTYAINPGLIFGERDVYLSAARVFRILRKSPMPFVNPGWLPLSDADDVAEAHLLAPERGKPGRRYIVVSANADYMQFMTWIAAIVGRSPPLAVLPAWVAKGVGALGELQGRITGREPGVTADMIVVGCSAQRVSAARAIEELGLEPTDVMTSMRKSYRWADTHGLLDGS